LYAAVLAEPMMTGFGTELVVGQFTLAGQKAKGVGLNDRAPPAGLGAECAVALGGTRTQIDIRLIADRSAMTTSYVFPSSVDLQCCPEAVYHINIAITVDYRSDSTGMIVADHARSCLRVMTKTPV
jgi:hypothetical protein